MSKRSVSGADARRGAAESELESRFAHVLDPAPWRRWRPHMILVGLLLYGAFCAWSLSVRDVLERAHWSIAGQYLADWVSWESRPDIALDDPDGLVVDFPRFDPLRGETLPKWLRVVSGRQGFPEAVRVRMGEGLATVEARCVTLERDGTRVDVRVRPDGPVEVDGELPDWIEQRRPGGKLVVRFGLAGRVEVTDDEVKVRRRFLGWENFLFDARSAFHGLTAAQAVRALASEDRLDPARSNLALAWHDILYNAEWQHLDVWTKLLQTIVMAFAGTLLATLVALPTCFLAARNIVRNRLVNHAVSHSFDFLRSIDMLIWALFFTRAFGPGPLAGIAAIFFTDTGTLGKLYAEALENIDERQLEGTASLGASALAVQRYGVLPQVLPVLLGQTLYFWESNVRSATIIGAVGAGGIGLKLWEAMRTNQDWENVAYMVLLILAVVYLIDRVSGALRARLAGDHRTEG